MIYIYIILLLIIISFFLYIYYKKNNNYQIISQNQQSNQEKIFLKENFDKVKEYSLDNDTIETLLNNNSYEIL